MKTTVNEMTNQEYGDYVDQKTPNSKLLTNCIKAFLIGGSICAIGQLISFLYKSFGLDEDSASTSTSITLVFMSALLTGLGIYPRIAKHGGGGTLVPITGFANSVTAPAIEAKTEGLITGVGTKIFTISGPVILYGEVASVAAGIVYLFIKAFISAP